jgi:hypothetical protein
MLISPWRSPLVSALGGLYSGGAVGETDRAVVMTATSALVGVWAGS